MGLLTAQFQESLQKIVVYTEGSKERARIAVERQYGKGTASLAQPTLAPKLGKPYTTGNSQGIKRAYHEGAWLREVEPCHVQEWLQAIAREYGLSKTTLAHVKHLLGGVFTFALVNGYFKGVNPVTPVEIPAFAPSAGLTFAYSLREVTAMVKVLPEPAATVVALAAFSGLRLGEIRGLTWEAYKLAANEHSFGELHILRSCWHQHIDTPKTEASEARVPVIDALAERLAAHRKRCMNPFTGPIFANGAGNPLCLDYLCRTTMRGRTCGTKNPLAWLAWIPPRSRNEPARTRNRGHRDRGDPAPWRCLRHPPSLHQEQRRGFAQSRSNAQVLRRAGRIAGSIGFVR